MEHDQQIFGSEYTEDQYQPAEYQSGFGLDLNQALQIDPDDAEELDVQEFRRLIEKFYGSPHDFATSDSAVIAKFVQWINYPGADEYLKSYGILQRYNNELENRIWVQHRELDFTKKSEFDVDNFRYTNGGGPKDLAKFLAQHKFLVCYWYIKEQNTKLRKCYHPDQPLALIVQYEEMEPPKKKQRTTRQDSGAPKNQSPTHEAAQIPESSYNSDLTSNGSMSNTSSPNSNNYSYNQANSYSTHCATPTNYSNFIGSTNNSYSNNTNAAWYYQGSTVAVPNTNGYNYHQASPSQISNGSPDSNANAPYVLKEDYVQQQHVMNLKIEQITYEVQQTKKDVSSLAQSLSNLSVTVASHDRVLERHEYEIAELSINVNREICTALLTIFKQQSGFAPVGKSLAKLIRSSEFLNRTSQQLPNDQISKVVRALECRKILRPRSSCDNRWELDVEMAKKYGLLE